MTTVNKSAKDRVIIFDTTLRDGEQCPGASSGKVQVVTPSGTLSSNASFRVVP